MLWRQIKMENSNQPSAARPTNSDSGDKTSTFNQAFINALITNEGTRSEGIPALAKQYNLGRVRIPGAPPIEQLEPKHIPAVINVLTFVEDPDKNWDGLCARWKEEEEFLQQANNPFFPKWFGKTDAGSIWMQDTGPIDAIARTKLDQLFYETQRLGAGTLTESLRPAPIADKEIMQSILDSARQFMNILFQPMGYDTGKNSEFRLSTTLPMLASFGYDGFRFLADHIADFSDEEDFQHYRSAPDEMITADLEKSVGISGYPINIGLIDAHDVIEILERCKLSQPPRWLPSLILIHIRAHGRIGFEKFSDRRSTRNRSRSDSRRAIVWRHPRLPANAQVSAQASRSHPASGRKL